jgi:glycosyltransferase involved in cell wall biosynthesis
MMLFADASVLELPATGVGKTLLGLYVGLVETDPSVQITMVHRRALLTDLPPSLAVLRSAPLIPRRYWSAGAFPRLARRYGPRAIFHFPWNGGIPALPSGTLTVSTIHDVLPLIIPGYFPRAEDERSYRMRTQATIDLSSLVFTDSRFSRDQILKNFRIRREPLVLPCATDMGSRAASVRVFPSPYLLYVGGLDPRKSFDRLIRVFTAMIKEEEMKAILVVVGEIRNAPQYLVDALNEGVRAGVVHHAGYVTEPELASLYDNALALVYPSAYEGFGLPPLEAMTRGCPVIAARATSIPEVCGSAAEYVHPENDRSLADAIRRVVSDHTLRASLAARGREQAARFSWKKSASMFLDALQSLSPAAP